MLVGGADADRTDGPPSGFTEAVPRLREDLKALLHLAAMCAIRYDQELKAYYIRKVSDGKNKMSVINAVRNKLVHRIMAVIQRQTPFIKSQEGYYQNSNLNTCFSS